MNRADRQGAKQRRREVLIHQLQERNQELHEKIVRLQREYGSNKRVIEELQGLTSEEEYEDSVEDISSVELIEPSASNPFIAVAVAQRGDRIGTGAAQIQDSRGSGNSNNLPIDAHKKNKERGEERKLTKSKCVGIRA
jgi:hypothetical protein